MYYPIVCNDLSSSSAAASSLDDNDAKYAALLKEHDLLTIKVQRVLQVVVAVKEKHWKEIEARDKREGDMMDHLRVSNAKCNKLQEDIERCHVQLDLSVQEREMLEDLIEKERQSCALLKAEKERIAAQVCTNL